MGIVAVISEELDFRQFLSAITNLELCAILQALDKETHDASRLLKSRTTAPQAGRYKTKLNQLEHILQQQTKPTGMRPLDLLEIRTLIIRLVYNDELPQATLRWAYEL